MSWSQVTLDSAFSEIRNGFSIKQSFDVDGLPISRIETIADGTVNYSKVGYAGIMVEQKDEWLLRTGDILFSHINSVPHLGKCAIFDGKNGKMIHGMNLLRFRANTEVILPKYAYYVFKTAEFKIKMMKFVNKSVNQASISTSNLKKITISIPPLDEQKRIADILDKAGEIEKYSEESQEMFSQLLEGLFVDTFGDLVLNPFDYPIRKLGEICDVRDGTHDSPSYVSQGYPLITSKNLKNGSIEFESANLISRQDYDKVNQRSKVDFGDVIMPMIGTIGGPIIVDTSREFAIKNVALIKFNDSVVLNIYVKALLESHYFDYLINKISRGGTQKFISLKNIREFAIPVPPLEKQQDFATIVNQIHSINPNLSLAKENSLSIAQELLLQS